MLRSFHPSGQPLTNRETGVLKLLVKGLTNEQIAERLALTPATIAFHLHSIYAKLGISTHSELVAHVRQRRIVTDD